MTYAYNAVTGEIIDADDGQIIATMSESSTPEQGESLVAAYNSLSDQSSAASNEFDILPALKGKDSYC